MNTRSDEERRREPPPSEEEQKQTAARIHELVGALELIPRYPRRNPQAQDAAARWFCDRCPTAQDASLLIDYAIEEITDWEQAGGFAALTRIYRKFLQPPEPETTVLTPAPDEIAKCKTCSDYGTVTRDGKLQWCTCDSARRLKADKPDLTDRWNAATGNHRTRPAPAPIAPATRRRIEAEIAAAMEARKKTGSDRKQPEATGNEQ